MQELNNLLADNGLKKILCLVRSQLQTSKEDFLNASKDRFDAFYSPDEIDNRILRKLWADLERMKCNYLCPWCGMPCCGTSNCNDSYVRGGLPASNEAKYKHSCQFHRDSAITGTGEIINDKVTDRSPNNGDCPRLIEINMKWRITDPANDGSKITVPSPYYNSTWKIKSNQEDPDQGSGYFWQWFLAFVSSHSN